MKTEPLLRDLLPLLTAPTGGLSRLQQELAAATPGVQLNWRPTVAVAMSAGLLAVALHSWLDPALIPVQQQIMQLAGQPAPAQWLELAITDCSARVLLASPAVGPNASSSNVVDPID